MKKAFTLIELLVVISVLSLISALLFPNYMSARERARDTQRKNDLKQIQNALEMYKLDQPKPEYPDSLPASGSKWFNPDTGVVYLKSFPKDPVSGNPYTYLYNSNTLTYDLCACLENKADPEGIDCSNCSENTCFDKARKCYKVSEP